MANSIWIKNLEKTFFKNVTMVTKMLHVHISVMVPDRPTIIDRQELIYSLSSHTMTCDLWWPWRSQKVTYMNFTKKQFLSQFSTLTLQVKIKIIIRCMHKAYIFPHATHFLSRDVFNVIFAKTSITPFFFYAKDKVKTKIIQKVCQA